MGLRKIKTKRFKISLKNKKLVDIRYANDIDSAQKIVDREVNFADCKKWEIFDNLKKKIVLRSDN